MEDIRLRHQNQRGCRDELIFGLRRAGHNHCQICPEMTQSLNSSLCSISHAPPPFLLSSAGFGFAFERRICRHSEWDEFENIADTQAAAKSRRRYLTGLLAYQVYRITDAVIDGFNKTPIFCGFHFAARPAVGVA